MAASDCEMGCFTETENSVGFVGVGACLGVLAGFGFKEDEMMRYEGDRERKRVADIDGRESGWKICRAERLSFVSLSSLSFYLSSMDQLVSLP